MLVLGLSLVLIGLGLVVAFGTQRLLFAIPLILAGAVCSLSSGLTQIPAGTVGVTEFFGEVDAEPLSAGLHVINPLKTVTRMSVQTQQMTMHAGSQADSGETIPALSADGMQMPLDVTILYRAEGAAMPWIYQHLGTDYEMRVVVAAMRSAIREAVAEVTAQEAYSTKREAMVQRMEVRLRAHIRALLDEYQHKDEAIVVQQVLLRNIQVPQRVREAIEQKLAAEQAAAQMVFVNQKEQLEAERKRIEAQGISDFQRIVSEGISDKLLAWKGIEATMEVATSNNAKVVIIGKPENGLPLIFDSGQSPSRAAGTAN